MVNSACDINCFEQCVRTATSKGCSDGLTSDDPGRALVQSCRQQSRFGDYTLGVVPQPTTSFSNDRTWVKTAKSNGRQLHATKATSKNVPF
ncbi:hypothetical protein GW17_00004939 [Ensete ventricosum]|nr:hypothetical protein GW17_00004939 [Ensete ventricosum]